MNNLAIAAFGSFGVFLTGVAAELDRAEQLHGANWPHTGLAEWALVLGEEAGEVQKAVLDHRFGVGDQAAIQSEAVQVAAMAFKLWEAAQ
jgi:NTP pyrophosphatase (non-canonical NTP hydrolase)